MVGRPRRGVHRRLGHERRNVGDQPRIEGRGNDVLGPEPQLCAVVGGGDLVGHVLAGELRQGVGASDLHLHVHPAGAHVESADFDLDGYEDALLEAPGWAAWVSARGGRMWAFDDRRALWNYGDTLARRAEHYHAELREAEVGGGEGKSIHDRVRLKEPGLAALAAQHDQDERDSFRDQTAAKDQSY